LFRELNASGHHFHFIDDQMSDYIKKSNDKFVYLSKMAIHE